MNITGKSGHSMLIFFFLQIIISHAIADTGDFIYFECIYCTDYRNRYNLSE